MTMELERRALTTEQSQLLNEIEAAFGRTLQETLRQRTALRAAALPTLSPGEEGSLHCWKCVCPAFLHRPEDDVPIGPDAPFMPCGRFGCHHSFLQHDIS